MLPVEHEQRIAKVVEQTVEGMSQTDLYRHRWSVVARIATKVGRPADNSVITRGAATIESSVKCYAAHLTLRYGGKNKGYPSKFEEPELFPGRMAQAAKAKDLRGQVRTEKPWLNDLPRLIFISDMGDSFSATAPFGYLREEIIEVVKSPAGCRHTWLWLTKRPDRMLKFDRWLESQKIDWPENVVAMTSVTSSRTTHRVLPLAKLRARCKGISVEPLWTPVSLPLQGIDWVILGGESGKHAKPFDLEWARNILTQCRAAGTAFFLKQLGRCPVDYGVPIQVKDKHGGDWSEWPECFRIRQVPQMFNRLVVSTTGAMNRDTGKGR